MYSVFFSASILVTCIAGAAAVSSFLRAVLSTHILMTYTLHAFRAQPNRNGNSRESWVAPHGRITFLQFFGTMVGYTSWTTCINGCTTVARTFSAIQRSRNSAKLNLIWDNKFFLMSPIKSRRITSCSSFSPSNSGRNKEVSKIWPK